MTISERVGIRENRERRRGENGERKGEHSSSQSLRGQNNSKAPKGSPNKELPAEEARPAVFRFDRFRTEQIRTEGTK